IEQESGKDLFVHHSEVRGGYLREGENVEFEIGEGQKGPCAVSVQTAS
ncbi:MAG: cold shock domain-containing protein, partial [SAR324 cluster bacterium]|nr:cold shock domain-containing protein [SAR324 cluster bacterium]